MCQIQFDYSTNNQLNEQISVICSHKVITNQSNILNKFIQDLNHLFLENEEKINHICKVSHDIIKKFTDVRTEEKRKLPEKPTIEEKETEITVAEIERQKKQRSDESDSFIRKGF